MKKLNLLWRKKNELFMGKYNGFDWFIFISECTKEKQVNIYKIFVARAKLLWGNNVHSFFVVVGAILMGLSSLFFLGIWG